MAWGPPDSVDEPAARSIQRSARRRLASQAAYELVVGTVAVTRPDAAASFLGVRHVSARRIGIGALAWAGLLGHLAYHGATRRQLALVTVGNAATLASIAVAAVAAEDAGVRGRRLGVAADLGLHLDGQLRLLRRWDGER